MDRGVAYHEGMHTTIWEWIRERCENREQTPTIPNSPQSILRSLIDRIDSIRTQNALFHPSRTPLSDRFVVNEEEEYNIFPGNWMNDFGERVCSKGQRLYDASLQRKISWFNMRDILEFYLNDCTNYIHWVVNSIMITHSQLNEFLELGINITEEMNDDLMNKNILWSRYLTGTRIWTFGPGTQYRSEILARGEQYWSDKVYNAVFNYRIENPSDEEDELGEIIQIANRQFVEQTTVTQLTETEQKKNEALRRIQDLLDDVQEDIGDGVYLDLMNILGGNFLRRR
jgi:hypothetical protein